MNNGQPPILSIITVVFNGAATIQRAIDSVLAHDSPEVEYIIIDGASTDGTVDIIERNRSRLAHFVSEPDGGIYPAWNKGLRAARGRWIAFLGADDWYVQGGIAAYLDAIARAGERTELISSRVRYHAAFSAPFEIGKCWAWPAFQRHMTVAHVGAVHRKSLFDRLGTFDESYRICGDYELLLRARNSLIAEFFPLVTAEMSGGGVSNNQLQRTYDESCRAKHEAGGRPLWRCKSERAWDHFRARVKRRLPSIAK